ncbi:DEAD/DEAH box helicase family protein [Bradyrhizobium barranii subsp. apii]|uniref:DEAD/DEAH box helicase family protein n=1 Tax=Bradyrhizobium barranii TaxID=2992140 RepID=UPI001AA1733E|nr:DEAD/DEAH box helicase family protein [Bradyrhizobium barranii]UPT95365.1 DEAD/DEAH box helicase family protein [Bradyrhizobium barranii subsp. apii]
MDAATAFRAVKSHYRSGRDDLSADFFRPCLRAASLYRRAAGYFSTSALLNWTDALSRVAMDGELVVRVIASPELSPTDSAALRELDSPGRVAEYQAIIVDRILEEIVSLLDAPRDRALRARIFTWLVANDRLQIKFAFPDHIDQPGIFHEKIGVFDFPGGERVAFTGSANETSGGHRRNYESIDVYRSWIEGEQDRVAVKAEQFDEAWTNSAQGLHVLSPSPAVLQRIRERAPRNVGAPHPVQTGDVPALDPKWRHQEEALSAFLEARSGILEMATGTGKTRTALKILDALISSRKIDSAIITMDGTDLLDQWAGELDQWNLKGGPRWLVYRHFERHHELGEFALDPSGSLIVISRGQLRKLIDRLPETAKRKMIIVHDEVHGLGMPSLVEALKGRHAAFPFRVGLSATPDRAYDSLGNDFVNSEIGPTIFRFSLEAAISRGVLSEFDYLPLAYDLTASDRDRLQSIYSKKAARQHQGNPMSNEELWTEIAKVYKTAEMKPEVFGEYLQTNPAVLERTIIFVETKEYGERILEMLHKHTHLYRTYYAEDDRDHLVAFARGEIDCLITCHRISQGIDIRSLKTVVLFASARAKLETIQRIGRCLRIDPDHPESRALVVDFVRPASPADPVPNADQERCAWLTAIAKVRRGDSHGT